MKSFWDDTPVGEKHQVQAALAKEAGYDVRRYGELMSEFTAKSRKIAFTGRYRRPKIGSPVFKTAEQCKKYGMKRTSREKIG